MSEISAESHPLTERPLDVMSSDPVNYNQMLSHPDKFKTNNTESYTSGQNSSARVRFLEPHSANMTLPIQSNLPENIPSFRSFETVSLENINDFYQDGLNSVSRGLQTDINNSSIVDWVLAQKSSSTNDRYIKI